MVLLEITALPALEETVIDWLLVQPDIHGFSSVITYGHGENHHLSLAEQVTGRRRQISFTIELSNDVVQSVLDRLKQELSGCQLHFRLMPMIESGIL